MTALSAPTKQQGAMAHALLAAQDFAQNLAQDLAHDLARERGLFDM